MAWRSDLVRSPDHRHQLCPTGGELLASMHLRAFAEVLPLTWTEESFRLAGDLRGSDRSPGGEQGAEVRAVLVCGRRILLDDVQFVDDAEICEGLQLSGVQVACLVGEAVDDLTGLSQLSPRPPAVACPVQVDQGLSIVADEISQRGSIGPVEQRHIEAVRAVDGMCETGQLRVNATPQLSEAVVHPAQVGVETAAGVLDRLSSTLP